MDMLKNQNRFFLDYVRQHNHNPNQYTQYFLDPKRNSLCFDDLSNIECDNTIANKQIKEKINFLKNLGFVFNNICEIKTTEYSWYLNYNGDYDCDCKNIEILLSDDTLKYLAINTKILKQDFMIEYINSEKISYNPLSFRQSDDSIKYHVYNILQREIISTNIYFLGGEMVFIAKLLKPIKKVMYTDYISIYDDAKLNFVSDHDNIHLINYDKDKLKYISTDYILIANTSKHGLGQNLCKELIKLNLDEIIIISCNRKSFIRDLINLQHKYKINKMFDISTNYMVSVYFLKIYH
jgi:hypothetical protein